MARKIPMIGKRFGRLLVLEEYPSEKQGLFYRCICDCGSICVVLGVNLRNGHTKSCGCLKGDLTIARTTIHGKRNSRLYRIWHGMKSRCYFSNSPNFADYGGRGITVCEEWRNSFATFYAWAISTGYSDDLSLDRKDNNKGYCPDNCKWSTRTEQANNKRNNTPIEIDGITMNLTQWAKVSGVQQQTISYRYKKGLRGADLIKPPDPMCSEKGKKSHIGNVTRVIKKGE